MSQPSAHKIKALQAEMTALGICENEIKETFILGSGKGGQKQNKSHNCVQLRHMPTGISVKCQKSRHRSLNQFLARRQLCRLIAIQYHPTHTIHQDIKRQIKQKKRRRRRSASGQNPPPSIQA